ncbi:MAG TPA: CoA pyrophosphatase [Deltaproteobacteria bacterium]|nr:CoA pyrophosphatase [Deltaproteobacteria bacterium]HQI00273.1 CoA pyrophosphatase [Deltaproteobacteria bacterium]HQJ09999.1 CoA pyrophosphatase [Deltaproteobacteria bacterium]
MLHDRAELKRHIADVLGSRERRIIPRDNLRESAVLVPLSWDGDDPFLLVTKRSMSVEHHKGEISFPGGRAEESDESLVFTALREAEEEIGLKPKDVEVLGLLDDHISIVGYHITPVVGVVPCPYEFTINSESETLLFVSLASALQDTVWMAEETSFMGKGIHIYYLQIDGGVIWGATARILKHFVDLIAGRTIPFGEVSPEAKAWVKGLLTMQAGYRLNV